MGSFEKPKANDTTAEFWSKEEEERLLELADDDDLTLTEVAERFENRTRDAVKNKLRKLRKARGEYNYLHDDEKYALNEDWIEFITDNIEDDIHALDGYAGVGKSAKIYLDHGVTRLECCEIEEKAYVQLVNSLESIHDTADTAENGRVTLQRDDQTTICYQDNVNNLLHRKVGDNGGGYDFIDLDPCGSPFTSVPQAIRLIDDGYMAVTYGDLQLQRWGRHAPLMKAYRMPECDSFEEVIEYMIGWTMFEGVRQENSEKTRKLTVEDAQLLSDKNVGVIRVLYRVQKTGKLAPVLNHLGEVLIGIDEEENPLAARFEISDYITD